MSEQNNAFADQLYKRVQEMQEASYTFGDTCKNSVEIALDGVLDVINELSQSPASIPEQVAQAKKVNPTEVRAAFDDRHLGYEFPSDALRAGAFDEFNAEWRLATQSAKQGAQPAEARGECAHCGTARPLHLLTCPVAEKGMAEGEKKKAPEPLRQLLIDLSNNTYFCGLHLADDAKYAAYLHAAEKAEQGLIELFAQASQVSVKQAPVVQEVTQQAAKAETAGQAKPYAYEESDGDSSSLIYASWFNNGRGKMDPECTYEPLYLAPTTSTVSASGASYEVPAGFALVPLEITPAMRSLWNQLSEDDVKQIWDRMLHSAAQAATDKSED